MSFDICKHLWNHLSKQKRRICYHPRKLLHAPYCRFYSTSKHKYVLTSFIHLFLLLLLLFCLLLHFTFTDSSSTCVCGCVWACIFFHPAFWYSYRLWLSIVVLPFPCWGSWFGYIAIYLLILLSMGTGESSFRMLWIRFPMDILKLFFEFFSF